MSVHDAPLNFEGFMDRDCGEHRTVGSHRAWCYECTEWCYPDAPCKGCEIPMLKAELQKRDEEKARLVEEFRILAKEWAADAAVEPDGRLADRFNTRGDVWDTAAQLLEDSPL